MVSFFNARPSAYIGPRGAFERRICKLFFQHMVVDRRIAIDFGDGVSEVAFDRAQVVLAAPRLWHTLRILVAPGLWVGKSFVAGEWFLQKGTLAAFIDIIWQAAPPTFGGYYRWAQRLRGIRHYLRQHLLNRLYSRRVRSHYEIDSKIYEMILDSEMLYTCAFFNEKGEELETAQLKKLSLTFGRLGLSTENPRILDIGSGWGAFERYAVRNHTTATIDGLSISKGQIDWAIRKDAGVLTPSQRSRVRYRLQDYISYEEFDHYDAVCAIGMIEHVGLGGYQEFFKQVARLLKPGGTALIHTIVAPARGIPTNRWIDRYIFTGGYAPSLSELLPAIERHPFCIEAVYLHGPQNYRWTIEKWTSNLVKNSGKMRDYLTSDGASAGDAEKALRTWYFYLSSVRNMFLDDDVHAYQIAQLCLKRA